MKRGKINGRILSQEALATGIYSMQIYVGNMAGEAIPGQFVILFCKDQSRKLGRPLSICDIDRENQILRIVYRVAGKGTEEFSKLSEGDEISLLGPLGNGYHVEGKRVILTAGGIGIPPMLALAKSLDCEKTIVLGYRDSEMFLKEEFEQYGTVYIATDDGSFGVKGNIIDAMKHYQVEGDTICACGPTPMLRALKAYAVETKTQAWFSLEEHMACGIGVCLGCAVPIKSGEGFEYKRVCKDGPVFNSKEIMFNEM